MCIAAAIDDTKKIQLYIEAGIPVTLGDYDGRTPLHIAACNQSTTMCSLLLAAGADRNAVDAFGNTPDLAWLNSSAGNHTELDAVSPHIDRHVSSLSLIRT
jgi:ankyrin repeat protein